MDSFLRQIFFKIFFKLLVDIPPLVASARVGFNIILKLTIFNLVVSSV